VSRKTLGHPKRVKSDATAKAAEAQAQIVNQIASHLASLSRKEKFRVACEWFGFQDVEEVIQAARRRHTFTWCEEWIGTRLPFVDAVRLVGPPECDDMLQVLAHPDLVEAELEKLRAKRPNIKSVWTGATTTQYHAGSHDISWMADWLSDRE